MAGCGDDQFAPEAVVVRHTFTKSCSCDSTQTVLPSVGYHVSCLFSVLSWNSWLTLSFSLISSPVRGFRASARRLRSAARTVERTSYGTH